MSISDSLHHLEIQIGFPPFMGASYGEEAISDPLRNAVVSWLTIKGIDKSSLDKSSLLVLGKMYKIEPYFNSVMLNQERDSKRKPYKKYTPPISTDGWDLVEIDEAFPETKPIPSTLEYPGILPADRRAQITPSPTAQSFNPNQFKPVIEVIARQIIKEEQDKTITTIHKLISEELDKNNTITKEIAKNITEQKIYTEIQYQSNELKKFIEEQIFQGHLNHKIQTLAHAPLESIEPNQNPTTNNSLIPILDPNYHFDPYATKVIRSALSMCENLYVYGDTGCGKTTHLEQVCSVLNRGLVRINPHDGITREMFLGGMKLINNETIFIEGALPTAMRNGHVFLVDEISFLPPNLTAILNPIGEKGGKLYIPETSEWISPAPGFCLFATDNTGGKGDRTGNYTGTEVQNTATLDRFAFCLKMNYLPQDKEREMLENRFPNQDGNEIENMLLLARDIRLAFSRGELSLTFSTRKLIKFFDQRINNFSIEEALSNTILSWLDEDDETLVKTMIDRLQILEKKEMGIPYDVETRTNLETLKYFILNNKNLEAIKLYRTIYYQMELKEAENAIEEIMSGIKPIPQNYGIWSKKYEVSI